MARRHYLITYDISDDRRRDKVFHTLRDNGDHAQYSVFFCQLNATELAMLSANLNNLINSNEDQILVVDLGNVNYDVSLEIETLGRAYEPPVRTMIV